MDLPAHAFDQIIFLSTGIGWTYLDTSPTENAVVLVEFYYSTKSFFWNRWFKGEF
jgi:hypothetical protein